MILFGDSMLPRAINYNNKIYNTIGMIKLNEGAFLVCKKDDELINFDFTKISGLLSNIKIQIKQPSMIEFEFMNFIQNKIQEKINNKDFKTDVDINYAFTDINRYINTTNGILVSLQNVQNNVDLNQYFSNLMRENKYFKQKENYPEYNEQVATMILTNPQPNFDVEKFVNLYFYQFNIEQINLLLSNFQLNEFQMKRLEKRKNELTINTNNSNSKSNLGKRKTFALPGIKENKEAAFIDTLLLSFTVGIMCGIYLMYFVLTIMS